MRHKARGVRAPARRTVSCYGATAGRRLIRTRPSCVIIHVIRCNIGRLPAVDADTAQGPRLLNVTGTNNVAVEERPLDALLAAYAAKTLSAPLAALVAANLELKLDNRAYVAALEAAHGVFLEELEPVPLVGRDRRLVNIFASQDPDEDDPAPASTRAEDTVL